MSLKPESMNDKNELLSAIAGKNRGLLANEIDKVAILAAIANLEDRNPNPNPLERVDLLQGNWRLLYTTSRELLGLNRFPLLQLGEIYQYLQAEAAKVYNIAEIVGIPGLEGIVSVAARFEIVSQKRVNVRFERSILAFQRWVGYKSATEMVRQIESGKKFLPVDMGIEGRDRQGWLEITYLDEELRINRGNEGSVFVLAKAV
ncbi:MAG: PAP/fibrillin family protein [Jaaginema sp. PMC 1079.18]|nr:PAP/fibrillin family protein [Jaaginema sp. PMC 1080.18]MEC4849992.1 PAP/fibrillin family protein [Jaaginema sp. PMC 1079.18]MEC4865178.1 PAP/fibrillin family protein [Jaaginema sp. PMC 1078.18]